MSRLLPYETILKAREGDPEAVNAVLLHYAGYIRYFSKVNGQVNAEVEDYVKQRLIDCQFKFRLNSSIVYFMFSPLTSDFFVKSEYTTEL